MPANCKPEPAIEPISETPKLEPGMELVERDDSRLKRTIRTAFSYNSSSDWFSFLFSYLLLILLLSFFSE